MLSKKNRLRRADFSVKRSWSTFRDTPILLRASTIDGLNKVSVIVPKSVIKSAVRRHSIKRLIYSCVEKYGINKRIGSVFVFRLIATHPPFTDKELQKSVEKLLNEVCSMLR